MKAVELTGDDHRRLQDQGKATAAPCVKPDVFSWDVSFSLFNEPLNRRMLRF